MNLGLITTAVFVVLVAFATLIGYSKGKKYVWQYTLTRLIINVLAVIIAIPLTRFVSLKLVGVVLNKVLEGSSDSSLATLREALPVTMGVVEALAAMMLGLVLFFFVRVIVKFVLKFFKYSIFALISGISDAIGGKRDRKKATASAESVDTDEANDVAEIETVDSVDLLSNEVEVIETAEAPKNKRKRAGCYALKPQLASILIGIIGCIFGVVVVFAPFTGAIGIADEALTTLGDTIEKDSEDYEIYVTAKEFTSNLSVRFSNKFGGKLIFNGLTTYKVNGTKIKLKNEAKLVTTIADSVQTITNENAEKEAQKSAVADVVNAFDRSAVIPLVLADVVNQLALSLEGDGELADIMGFEVENESASDSFTLEAVRSFKECTPETIKADVKTLGDIVLIFIEHDVINSIENPEDLLSKKAFVEELLTAFFENDRISSLASTFVEMGIDMLESELGMTDTLAKAHENMVARLESVNTMLPDDELTEEVSVILTSYGIDVSEKGAQKVAESLRYYGASVALSKVEINGKDAPVNISNAAGFEAVSLLITKNEVQISHKDTIANPVREAHLIAEALYAITDLTTSLEGDVSVATVLSTVGTLLDNLSKTEMVGRSVVDKLILVMFQSEKVTDSLPMNTVEITKFVDSLVEGANGENKSYETVMSGIADMVDVLEKLSSSEGDDPTAAVTETIKNITPESAVALKHFATTDFVEELGVGKESSEGVANMLGNLFDELATAKDSDGLGLSDEEYAAEAEKISNLLDVTMSITDGTSDTSDIAIEGYVNDVMDSKILTNTIINSVYDESENLQSDPLNTEIELSDGEKTELVDSLNRKLSEVKGADYESAEERSEKIAETEKLIVAIGAYVNTGVTIEGGMVKIAD